MSSDLVERVSQRDLAEEIDAINAIYDINTIEISTIVSDNTSTDKALRTIDLGRTNSTIVDAEHPITTTIRLHIPNHPNLSFVLGFDEEYPESAPSVIGTASTSSRGEGGVAVDVLRDIISRAHQPGQVCLFEVISEASEKFEELNIGGSTTKNKDNALGVDERHQDVDDTATINNNIEEQIGQSGQALATLSLRDTFGIDSPPEWILSDIVTEKRSVFVGRVVPVASREQAKAYLDHLLATDKKVATATHNISAWRIREKRDDNTEMTFQDCDDDGETAAGGRLLHLMQLMDVWNVLVVVTRWYGGILLGPDRFRIINNVGKDALMKGGFQRDTSSGKEKGKKKGKK